MTIAAATARPKGLTQPGPLAALRPVKLSDMSGERVAAWLTQQAAERPTMAALSFRLLRAFIRWCGDTPSYRGVIPADAYKARDVKEAVPRVRAKEGDSLQREQLTASANSAIQPSIKTDSTSVPTTVSGEEVNTPASRIEGSIHLERGDHI